MIQSCSITAVSIVIALCCISNGQHANAFAPLVTTSRQQQWVSATTRTTTTRPEAVAMPLDVSADFRKEEENGNQAIQQPIDQPRIGVLLLNLGGPETGDDVEGFLYNLFADPDIIQLPDPLSPLQPVIAWLVSKRRAPKSRAAYESIGGGSPILKYSKAQAQLMTEALQHRHGLDVKAYIGMRYWHPFTEEALAEIEKDQIEALVIVPLYPQFSVSTSGSSLRVLQEEFSKHAHKYQNMVHTVVPSWYKRPGYIQAMVDLLMEQLDSFSDDELAEQREANADLKPRHVLFSAHGVPQSYIEAGDPYQQQMEECVAAISERLPEDVQAHLSYQSRVGPIEWLRPYTDDVLPQLGDEGVRNLVVVPISFVSEHIETLEEIDIEYRELAEESGITHWRRCPALNTYQGFVDDMADLVAESLAEPAQTVTEACVANRVRDVELQSLDERMGIQSAGVQGVGKDLDENDSTIVTAAPEAASALWEGNDPERWLARGAILAVLGAMLTELLSGKSLPQQLGL